MLIINSADRPLSEALRLMYEEGISSVAVVDNHFNVVGNISATDVKVCTIGKYYIVDESDHSSF